MKELITKINIIYLILFSKIPIAKYLHKNTNGRIMDHYNMSNEELLTKLQNMN